MQLGISGMEIFVKYATSVISWFWCQTKFMKSLVHHDYTVWHIWTCNLFVFFYTQSNWNIYRCNLRDLIRTEQFERFLFKTISKIPFQIAGHRKFPPIIFYPIVLSLLLLGVAVLWKHSLIIERINPVEGQNILIHQFLSLPRSC